MDSPADSLDCPLTYTHDGTTYTVRLITQEAKAEFQRSLESQARRSVFEARKDTPDEAAWRAYAGSVNAQIAAGYYAFHGEGAEEALKSFGGLRLLCQILFRTPEGKRLSEEKITEIFITAGDAFGEFIGQIFRRSFPNGRTDQTTS